MDTEFAGDVVGAVSTEKPPVGVGVEYPVAFNVGIEHLKDVW